MQAVSQIDLTLYQGEEEESGSDTHYMHMCVWLQGVLSSEND